MDPEIKNTGLSEVPADDATKALGTRRRVTRAADRRQLYPG
jgi:hypothetical protein